jgi:hypothetical protein
MLRQGDMAGRHVAFEQRRAKLRAGLPETVSS